MRSIWIIAEDIPALATLVSCARAVSPDAEITAFIEGDENSAREAVALGAARAYALPLPANTLWESYAPTLAEMAKAEKPALILLASSRRCRDLAAQMAALLDAPCFSGVKNLACTADGVSGETQVYGSLGVAKSVTREPLVLATLAANSFEPATADSQRTGEVHTLSPAKGVEMTQRKAKAAQSVNLGAAERVVGVGRGVGEEKDLEIISALAAALGADIGCSRPIAEFFKWMPEERYIGISGQQIKPKLYLAIGISGQAQHYFGVRDASVIVSVNSDPEALFSEQSDYYLVSDWKEAVPALMQALGKG